MPLDQLIPADSIMLIGEPWEGDKFSLIREMLVRCIAAASLEDRTELIWKVLHERELSMSTGIGQEVAIPHCSTDEVDDVLAHLAIVQPGLDFEAIDGLPVHIVVLLVTPKNQFDRHIKTLAEVARTFNDEAIRAALKQAATPLAAHAILAGANG